MAAFLVTAELVKGLLPETAWRCEVEYSTDPAKPSVDGWLRVKSLSTVCSRRHFHEVVRKPEMENAFWAPRF